jgi:hypothetical protein
MIISVLKDMNTQLMLQRDQANIALCCQLCLSEDRRQHLQLRRYNCSRPFSCIVATCVNYGFIIEDATVGSSYEYNKR